MVEVLTQLTRPMAGIEDPLPLLAGLVEHAPFGFMVYLPDGTPILANRAHRELFGTAPPPGYNILRDEVLLRQGFGEHVRRAFEGEAVRMEPHWFEPRGGERGTVRRVAIEASSFALRDAAGAVRYVAFCFKDVTAEMSIEAANDALRCKEEELVATLGSIGDAVVATDVAGRVVRMNPVAEEIMGISIAEAAGRPLDDVFRIVNEETRAPVESPVAKALREGRIVGLANHTVLVRGDGTERAIADSAAPIRVAGGEVRGVVLVFRDVTEEHAAERARRAQEEALRRSDDLLRFALRASRSLAWSIDFATRKVTFLENARGFGADPDLSQEERMKLLHPDDRARVTEALANAYRGITPPEYFYRIVNPATQEIRWMESRALFVRDDAGNVTGAAGLSIDVTERMTAEDLRARAAHLERQNERILEASRYKSEFLANMSHELRTPLNAIIGFAELLFDGQVDPSAAEHGEFLGDILASARHLLQLINDVLDLAKIESGKLEFFPEPVNIRGIVSEVCSILRPIAAEKRTRIEIQVDDALADVSIDPARFKQLLYNYISNALKFTATDGWIAIRVLSGEEGTFRVEVQDDGIGIAPADVARLFLEFEQIEGGALRKQSGTGLGLALTRRLVEAQGGRVGVHSTPGRGSVFYAVLPRRGAPVSITAPPLAYSGLTGRGPRNTGTNEP